MTATRTRVPGARRRGPAGRTAPSVRPCTRRCRGADLPGWQLAGGAAVRRGRACARGRRGRVGRRAGEELEHRRLDHGRRAHRRQDRAARRRGSRRGGRGRLHVREPLQGAERGDRHRPARPRGNDRRSAGTRRRIVSERTNFPTDLYIADTVARTHGLELVLVDADDAALGARRASGRADADARELPHRPHVPDGGGDARRARGRRADDLGSRALGRRRAGGRAWRRRPSATPRTSPSVAATST